MAFLDELFKGAGSIATAAWKASPPGARLHRMDRIDRRESFHNDWAAVQKTKNPDDKLKNMKTLMEKWPELIQLGQDYSQNAMRTDQETTRQSLSPEQRQRLEMTDSWGRSIERSTTTDEIGTLDEGERWMKIAKDASSDELALKAEKKAEKLLFPPEEETTDAGVFRSMMFGPDEGVQQQPAQSLPQGPTQQPATQPGHSFAPGATPPAQPPIDNRGMFAGDENPFLTPESQAKVDSFLDEDLSPTEGKQSPHTFEDIGIIQAGQQKEFQELEKMVRSQMPDMDLRQAYALHPESYKKLFAAIKNGVPDQEKGGTRKLTTQEIMQAIQSMGR